MSLNTADASQPLQFHYSFHLTAAKPLFLYSFVLDSRNPVLFSSVFFSYGINVFNSLFHNNIRLAFGNLKNTNKYYTFPVSIQQLSAVNLKMANNRDESR